MLSHFLPRNFARRLKRLPSHLGLWAQGVVDSEKQQAPNCPISRREGPRWRPSPRARVERFARCVYDNEARPEEVCFFLPYAGSLAAASSLWRRVVLVVMDGSGVGR